VFGVKLSEDISKTECKRVTAMAENFGSEIAINWLSANDRD